MIVQNPPESAFHWLYTNAPAAWLSALVATALLVKQLRKRPKRLVVREMPGASFVHVEPSLRHRITTAFDGRAINALTLTAFELYNEGSEPIQNAALTVTLPVQTVVLQATVLPRDCGPKCEVADNRATVTVPYVNPFQEHKQLLRLFVLADGETRSAKISGSGEGWSVRYSPLPGFKQIKKLRRAQVVSFVLFSFAILAYLWYLQRGLGIAPTEFSWRSAAAMIPAVALFVAFMWGWDRATKRMWRPTLKRPEQNEWN